MLNSLGERLKKDYDELKNKLDEEARVAAAKALEEKEAAVLTLLQDKLKDAMAVTAAERRKGEELEAEKAAADRMTQALR